MILLICILILALFVLGLLILKKIGARGCAACDNPSCSLRKAPFPQKKILDDSIKLNDGDGCGLEGKIDAATQLQAKFGVGSP
ncbi:MAG TPA: hypothetical protein ENH12_01750, partial [Proteobacteria bacterium]|nr:hypothetical protein [Pseudomonadota bacterium]